MNNLKFLLILAIAAFSLTSCEFDEICEAGEGPTVTKELELVEFHSLELNVSADVFITQGSEFKVVAEGQENIIDLLETSVRSGTWEVEFDRNCVRGHNGLSIFVTMPSVERLQVKGSGNITSENVLEGELLELKISGSGDMDLAVKTQELTARIEGSGSTKLEGTTDDLDVVIRGSGDVKAFDLEALRASVNVGGSGDVELNVEEFLDVTINGSGDVFFRGNPQTDVTINGSGDVRGV